MIKGLDSPHGHAKHLPHHRYRRQTRRRSHRHHPLLRARRPAAEPLRRASGYRSYNESAIRRLRFIRRAKDLGFTLEEIRDLLALSSDRRGGVRAVRKRAEQRLADIEARIAELTRIRKGLQQLIEACPGHGDPEHCPILRALADEETKA